MFCTFEQPPDTLLDSCCLPRKCGVGSVSVDTSSSRPYEECSVSDWSVPRRLIRLTSSDTRGLTPVLPFCEYVAFGGSPSRIADAGLITPSCGVPVSASNPNP